MENRLDFTNYQLADDAVLEEFAQGLLSVRETLRMSGHTWMPGYAEMQDLWTQVVAEMQKRRMWAQFCAERGMDF